MKEPARRISPYDSEHLPREIKLIEAFRERHPKLPQLACFDTAFHRTMPRVARVLPIPRRFDAKGVQRYGFHGLSYTYLMEELACLGDPKASKGRVILGHLGNSASLAAVRDGQSIDTSMGLTLTAGMPMNTRSDDLDSGLVWYLAHTEKVSVKPMRWSISSPGCSACRWPVPTCETCSAVKRRMCGRWKRWRYFVQGKKWIGAFAAVLGGLETLVFAGGIGANAPTVHTGICEGLGFLGIELEEKRNAARDFHGGQPGCGPRHSYGRSIDDCAVGYPRSRPWLTKVT